MKTCLMNKVIKKAKVCDYKDFDASRCNVSEKRLLADMRRADEDPSPERWSEVLEEVEITPSADWTKIRRRCEDVLRKCGDNRTIFNVARMLNVKTE